VARLGAGGAARGAGRQSDLVEPGDQGIGVDALEREVQVPGQPARLGPVERDPGHVLPEARQQPAPQARQPRGFGLALCPTDGEGAAQPDAQGDRQRPRPEPLLVAAAMEQRFQPDARPRAPAPPDVEEAHPLRSVDLVGGAREQVDADVLDVERDLAERLGGVGVEQHVALRTDLADGGQGLERADLAVRGHHRDQDRALADGVGDAVRVDEAPTVYRQHGRGEALPLEGGAGIEHGGMLGCHRDDVGAATCAGAPRSQRTLQGEVVALGGPAREDDLAGILGADRRRHALAGRLDRPLSAPTVAMRSTGRVPEVLGEERQHRLEHARVHRGGRVVVEVDQAPKDCPQPQVVLAFGFSILKPDSISEST
jgi:hypothetical protein